MILVKDVIFTLAYSYHLQSSKCTLTHLQRASTLEYSVTQLQRPQYRAIAPLLWLITLLYSSPRLAQVLFTIHVYFPP